MKMNQQIKSNASSLICVLPISRVLPQTHREGDHVLFPSCRAYFTDKEDQEMLAEFWEFDQKMIHEKYKSVVEGLETD